MIGIISLLTVDGRVLPDDKGRENETITTEALPKNTDINENDENKENEVIRPERTCDEEEKYIAAGVPVESSNADNKVENNRISSEKRSKSFWKHPNKVYSEEEKKYC